MTMAINDVSGVNSGTAILSKRVRFDLLKNDTFFGTFRCILTNQADGRSLYDERV